MNTECIDNEWTRFLSNKKKNNDNEKVCFIYDDDIKKNQNKKCNIIQQSQTLQKINNNKQKIKLIIENEEDNLKLNESSSSKYLIKDNEELNIRKKKGKELIIKEKNEKPIISELFISTKSKIGYLNNSIDLKNIFWKIKVIPYNTPSEGVIKKQIKYISETPEELEMVEKVLLEELYYKNQIITSINNPHGRIKFKDIRKITIGISKKDILSYRSKIKSAFYNCFVIILRCNFDGTFKEYHVKIFNTGRLKIPGVQSEEIYQKLLLKIINILQPFVSEKLSCKDKSTTILVNSNFNCGFYINQEYLYDILRYKYKIQCIYDPCSYPGIQCKFYYDYITQNMTGVQFNSLTIKENKKSKNNAIISFMIFRTGSILIVGRCDDDLLYKIFEFIKNILLTEYNNIVTINYDKNYVKTKNKKLRKRFIYVLDNNE